MEQTTMTYQQRLTKINKDRRILMKLLAKLRKQIDELLETGKKSTLLDELFKRRKDYRKRLTKLTNKRHEINALRMLEAI